MRTLPDRRSPILGGHIRERALHLAHMRQYATITRSEEDRADKSRGIGGHDILAAPQPVHPLSAVHRNSERNRLRKAYPRGPGKFHQNPRIRSVFRRLKQHSARGYSGQLSDNSSKYGPAECTTNYKSAKKEIGRAHV